MRKTNGGVEFGARHITLASVIAENHPEEVLCSRDSRTCQRDCVMIYAKPVRFPSAFDKLCNDFRAKTD